MAAKTVPALVLCMLSCMHVLSTAQESSVVSICVKNSKNATCHQQNNTSTIYQLSELTSLSKNQTNDSALHTLQVYLTGGVHSLTSNLDLKITEIKIEGVLGEERSTVQCENGTGINVFGNNSQDSPKVNIISIKNLVFQGCGALIKKTTVCRTSALYFHRLDYVLVNVTVAESAGCGLFAFQCGEQTIESAIFHNNEVHVKMKIRTIKRNGTVSVTIRKTEFDGNFGEVSGLDIYQSIESIQMRLRIQECRFSCKRCRHILHVSDVPSNIPPTEMSITDSTFTGGVDGTTIRMKQKGKYHIALRNSNFSRHSFAALQLQGASAIIDNCSFVDNTGTGINETKDNELNLETIISNSYFHSNGKALYLLSSVHISNCQFLKHSVSESVYKAVVVVRGTCRSQTKVVIENSVFHGNYASYGECSSLSVFHRNYASSCECSSLYVGYVNNVTLNNLNFSYNLCSGISIDASNVTVRNNVDLIGNAGLRGGALQLLSAKGLFPRLILSSHSQLNIINNTARLYGGGIFTDASCADRNRKSFFQFETPSREAAQDVSKTVYFSGNQAEIGGDIIFGGCFSKRSIGINGEWRRVNVKNSSDIFWDFVTSENSHSASSFVDYPNRVVFCDVIHAAPTSSMNTLCSCNRTIAAYRGLPFTIPLMVVDDSCGPSVEHFTTLVDQESGKLRDDKKAAEKNCSNFTFYVTSSSASQRVTLKFIYMNASFPAWLTVQLQDCPTGYRYDAGESKCICNNDIVLKRYGIECMSNGSLKVLASTWIGSVSSSSTNSDAVQKHCQNCRTENVVMTDSDELCLPNRTGVLCDACIEGHSLQLGRSKICVVCTDSTVRDVLLVSLFIIMGVVLIFVLFVLNLTVSTGLLNGLIFYTNVVYINNEIFLPITLNSETPKSLVVRFLSSFQVWMNLEFGTSICFLHGFDTYINTWIQFLFPIYLWLLIFLMVLMSRYSSRVSRLTSSRTVPVLATLLLLSYVKLLSASFHAFSFTRMKFISNNSTHAAWQPDANIPYLQGKHIPLFLMGCFVTVIYLIPFALLLLFGPLLQAKSQLRPLSWINRLKPLLDAFYGPFTSRYRYWPGILLLARIVLFSIIAFYSLEDKQYKFMSVSIVVLLVLILWHIVGRTAVSLYHNVYLDYLHLSFLVNLALLSIISMYSGSIEEHQQTVAIIMTGSVFAVFCGIVLYQFVHVLFRLKAIRKICKLISTRKQKAKSAVEDGKNRFATGSGCTHSTVQIAQSVELREPLLNE